MGMKGCNLMKGVPSDDFSKNLLVVISTLN